jgi:hypothetical protein
MYVFTNILLKFNIYENSGHKLNLFTNHYC